MVCFCCCKAAPAELISEVIGEGVGPCDLTSFTCQPVAVQIVWPETLSTLSRQQLQQLLCDPDEFLLMYNLVVLESKTKTSNVFTKLDSCWSKAAPAELISEVIGEGVGPCDLTSFTCQPVAVQIVWPETLSTLSRQQLQQLLCDPDDFLLMYNLVVLKCKTKTSQMCLPSWTAAGPRQLRLMQFQRHLLQRWGP